jgi:hypothetical protein
MKPRMKSILFCLILLPSVLCAERLAWKPSDFEPLTELPWEEEDESPSAVVERIFRETNEDIRYLVLGEYLRRVPLENMGQVFDLAVRFEGTNTPNALIELMLFIWAKRDPLSAWAKCQELFNRVGIEEGWLGYDSWNQRPPIVALDIQAIRKSQFWLRRETLSAFPAGVDASSLPSKDRVELLQAFVALWFKHFDSWPRKEGPINYLGSHENEAHNLIQVLEIAPYHLQEWNRGSGWRVDRASDEMRWRRWLAHKPQDAEQVIRSIESKQWPAVNHGPHPLPNMPASISIELLLVWRKADPEGLTAWAKRVNLNDGKHAMAALEARCLLMSEVDADTRRQWMTEFVATEDAADRLHHLAAWHPHIALDWADKVKTEIEWLLPDIVDGCVYGPWSYPQNTSHFGIGYINDHGVGRLSRHMQAGQWGMTTFMEQWGDIDIGEAARFGFKVLLDSNYAPREDLAKFFMGDDSFGNDGEIIDRTFCSMRVWAMVQPDEMSQWIEEKCPADMQESLRWLLKHAANRKETSP